MFRLPIVVSEIAYRGTDLEVWILGVSGWRSCCCCEGEFKQYERSVFYFDRTPSSLCFSF